MNDRNTIERYKNEHNIVMKRPKIKDNLVELKTNMKSFEISGDE